MNHVLDVTLLCGKKEQRKGMQGIRKSRKMWRIEMSRNWKRKVKNGRFHRPEQ